MQPSHMKFNIPFPFPPYPQQRDLMSAIHKTLENSQIGFFESPTGTGKSLSLICAALHWQRAEEDRILAEQLQRETLTKDTSNNNNSNSDKNNDDWLVAWQSEFVTKTDAIKENQEAMKKYNNMIKRVTKFSTSYPRPEGELGDLLKDDGLLTSNRKFSCVVKETKRPHLSNPHENKTTVQNDDDGDIDEFALLPYDSDDDTSYQKKMRNKKSGNFAKSTASDEDFIDSDNEEDDDDEFGIDTLKLPQIIYCSRTHSQVLQFVNEIRRTIYSDIRCVTLGSRRNLCINSNVRKLTSDSKMSEKCLDMQKAKGKSKEKSNSSMTTGYAETLTNSIISQQKHGKKQKLVTGNETCSFHSKSAEIVCSNFILSKVRDIEELAVLGRQTEACPYYSTRRAIKGAQVICMPYNILLHEDLRNSMGLKLKGRVIVFDEAHNLVDAVNQTYSAETTMDHLTLAMEAISLYLNRFDKYLSGKNIYYINLLNSVLKGLQQRLNSAIATCTIEQYPDKQTTRASGSKENILPQPPTSCSGASAQSHDTSNASYFEPKASNMTEVLNTNDFLFQSRLDNINFFKLKRHIVETRLVNRIGGFAEAQARKAIEEANISTSTIISGKHSTTSGGECGKKEENDVSNMLSATSALRNILSLLTCLTNDDADGCVVLTCPVVSMSCNSNPPPSIKFVMLNPSIHFRKIVDQSRSVILLGGTMKPFSFFTSFLFPHIPASRIMTFSCGHVVDRRNIKPIIVGSGPRGKIFEFTNEKRLSLDMTTELHNLLIRVTYVVPNGIVVFFTSYSYMESVLNRWKQSGMMRELQSRRPLFVEPRTSIESESIWSAYSENAHGTSPKGGAILFCVIGGKLSEGINFSDHLARCVIVVGMPYPDKRDAIIKEKLRFADSKQAGSGNLLYEAMCMKAVNQSIGRSIRHVGDYASVLLLDRRYSQQRIINQLPVWMKDVVTTCSSFEQAQSELNTFFKYHYDRTSLPHQHSTQK